MPIAVTDEFKALGLTKDNKRTALEFKTEAGQTAILEIPINALQGLSHTAIQADELSKTQLGMEYEPANLPVWKWEVGTAQNGSTVLRFRIPGSGAYGFVLDREMALALSEGLKEGLGLPVKQTQRPN
jgi:hypothetical protein